MRGKLIIGVVVVGVVVAAGAAFLFLGKGPGLMQRLPEAGRDGAEFSETLTDSLTCEKDGDDVTCEVTTEGEFSIKITAFAQAGLKPADFDKDSPFEITLGDFTHSATLGDDDGYKDGDSDATFSETAEICDANGENCKTRTVLKIKLKITAGGLLVAVAATTPEGVASALAAQHTDKQGAIHDTVPVDIQLGNHELSMPLAITGSAEKKTVKKADGDHDLSNVRLTGTLAAKP